MTAGAFGKVWLVGEDNPYSLDPRYALWCYPTNSAGGRLCHRVLGIESPQQYAKLFERRNLCERGRWNSYEAKESAARISAEAGLAPIVLLGAKVAKSFGVEYEPFKKVGSMVLLPHPSGRCRIWNVVGSYDRARRLVHEVAPWLP